MSEAGVLTGDEIMRQVSAGRITIDPFDEMQVNPASYDLRLGSKVAVYSDAVHAGWSELSSTLVAHTNPPQLKPDVVKYTSQVMGANLSAAGAYMDARKQQHVFEFDIHPERGWLLKPGIGYLMHTVERICTSNYLPVLDGKSSIGRLFIAVHVTAGYGDTGFDGQYTLEVLATHPVIVYPGMRIAQMRFHTVVGEVRDYGMYGGNYVKDAAMGPVPSRAWRQR